jgi:nicotinate phosphoribosyltransferase
MLTDTFTVRAFFHDFTSDPTRALRWDALRHDSGSPFEFITLAKKAWGEVEAGAYGEGGQGKNRKIGQGKKCVFSDSLDTEVVKAIQKKCDEAGIEGEWRFIWTRTLISASDYRSVSEGRFEARPQSPASTS